MSTIVTRDNRQGRLLGFLFNPPPLLNLRVRVGRFAERLARHPADLVTHLGMVRSNAYFAAGCPLELCDHAAARDVWAVIHSLRRATDLNPEPDGPINEEAEA